jgi:hypothetical protein
LSFLDDKTVSTTALYPFPPALAIGLESAIFLGMAGVGTQTAIS